MSVIRDWPASIEYYKHLTEVARSDDSVVFSARVGDDVVALKKIPDCRLSDENIRMEIGLWRLFESKYVIQYHDSFQHEEDVFIVSEFMDYGSLKRVVAHRSLEEKTISAIVHPILSALALLHAKKIIHSDIKGENILVNSRGEIKLCDFGLAIRVRDAREEKAKYTIWGTDNFMAPEMCDPLVKTVDEKMDIWSLGITAIELRDGCNPYASLNFIETFKEIVEGPPPRLKDTLASADFMQFLAYSLRKQPSARLSAVQLKELPFFQNVPGEDYIVQHLIQPCKGGV